MFEDQEFQAKKTKHDKIQEEQRKFRNLESDQKFYTDEVVILIKNQKGTIEKLQKENDTLKDLVTKIHEKKGQPGQFASNELENKIHQLKDHIKEEKGNQEQTKIHINNFQKKIVEKKSNFGGYNSGSENETLIQKQIKILENRLDKANQKFNESIAFNRQLKQVIQSLRRQRKIFDTLYQKLEKELQEKRKSMANIIEKANTAYEQRDVATHQMQTMKQKSKKETFDFEKELKELSHVILKSKLASTVYTFPKPRDQNFQEMNEDRDRTSKNLKQMRDKGNTNQVQKLQKYREDFAKIQAATQIRDFNQLIQIFTHNEEKNFKMFKYVNEQSNQIEELESSISGLQQQLNQYYATARNPAVNREMYVVELKQKLVSDTTKLEEAEEKYKKTTRTLKNLTTQVEIIFNTLECDRQIAKEVAGSKIVSQGNMTVFLGIIEQKIMRLIRIYKEKTFQDQSEYEQVVAPKEKVLKIPELLILDDFDQQQEQFDKLMTHKDFINKANQKIQEQSQKLRRKELRPKKKHYDK